MAQRSSELHRALADNADLNDQLASAAEKLVAAEQSVAVGTASDSLPTLTARELDVVREIAAAGPTPRSQRPSSSASPR